MSLQNPFSEIPPFWTGGPNPSGYYAFPAKGGDKSAVTSGAAGPITRSQYPITTGTSVIGIKFKDGVVMATDTMGSYGSMARYPDLQRVIKVNDTTIIAYTGDVADFQYLQDVIERRQIEEEMAEGGVNMRPEALHCWLTRVLYNHRSKFDPLWNTILVGGIQGEKPFLGCVDMIGTAWKEDVIATGLGGSLSIPSISDDLEKFGGADNLTEEQAVTMVKKILRVCYLRDCRATSRYHIAVVTNEGSKVEGPFQIDTNWEIAKSIKGYD